MATAIRRVVLPLLAFLIGALALGYSAVLYQESRSVEQHGLQSPVLAIDNVKKIKRSGNDITFRADFRFNDRDGRPVIARTAISEVALDAFRAGQPTQVRYLPDRPEIIRVVGEEDAGGSWLLVLVGCAALLFGAIGIFRPRKKRSR